MKVDELRKQSLEELGNTLKELLQESFKLRMQKATEQKPKTHLLKDVRRTIARVKTLITQKMNEGKQS